MMDLKDLASLENIISDSPVILVRGSSLQDFLIYWKFYQYIDGKAPIGIITISPEGDYFTNTTFISPQDNLRDPKSKTLSNLIGCLKGVSLDRLPMEKIKSLEKVIEIYCEKENEETVEVKIKEYSSLEKQELEQEELGLDVLSLLFNKGDYTAFEIIGEFSSTIYTVYPLLQKLLEERLIERYWGESSSKRGWQRRTYYTITGEGIEEVLLNSYD